jgi:hypothetical protein
VEELRHPSASYDASKVGRPRELQAKAEISR